MADVKICPNCGRRISIHGIFCPFCGEEIHEKAVVEKVVVEKPVPAKQEHTKEMQQKISKHLELKKKVQRLKKKKEILELKINNYDKLSRNEIPDCRPNEDAPDMATGSKRKEDFNIKWMAAAVVALIECI